MTNWPDSLKTIVAFAWLIPVAAVLAWLGWKAGR